MAQTIANFLAAWGFNVKVYENRVEIVGATALTVTYPTTSNPDTTYLTVEGDGAGYRAGTYKSPSTLT